MGESSPKGLNGGTQKAKLSGICCRQLDVRSEAFSIFIFKVKTSLGACFLAPVDHPSGDLEYSSRLFIDLKIKKATLRRPFLFFYGGLSSGLSQNRFHTNELSEIIKIKEPKGYENTEFLTHLYLKKKWSIRLISKYLGCSKTTVRNRLSKAGIEIYERKVAANNVLVKKVRRLRDQGISYQKIADLFNLWRIETSSGDGQWYSKTIRSLIK